MSQLLHLNFALNFETLAVNMMDKIEESWHDPFDPPIVIFPDRMLEHWFKLKWMSKHGSLANLKSKFLDTFLFEALTDAHEIPRVTRLPVALLRNMILAWFKLSDKDHRPNWETLSDEVRRYVQPDINRAEPDDSRLFDFANQISKLFMDYETTRPGAFKTKEGFIQTWQMPVDDNHRFFNRADKQRESWQNLLYRRIFTDSDSMIAHINKELEGRNIKYITLPQLYEKNRTSTGNIDFKGASSKPVFLFWHAGVGQFYRVALHEYSKTHEVYAYIQNPCMEFWEDITDQKINFIKNSTLLPSNDGLSLEDRDILKSQENQLLAKWGRAGRDNIKLWCESVDYNFEQQDYIKFNYECTADLHAYEAQPEDTLLHRIQELVSTRENAGTELPQDDSLTVTSAPSKIREIEHLHTKICQCLKAGANIRDILIVAPDINAYRSAIYQVFGAERTQVEENRQRKHMQKANANETQPEASQQAEDPALYIPFTIIDSAARESLTAHALDALFRIVSNRALSRLEFFELVRNPLVQNVRGLSSDEISAWEGWLTNMQVFRDRELLTNAGPIQYKDWQTGIKRLLLARLTDNRVQDCQDTLTPYADLESSDSDSLCRFIDAIESLEEVIKKSTERPAGLTREMLDDWFIPYLNSWISMNNAPRELSAENIIYQSVADSIEILKCQYPAGIETISWKCLEQTIRDAAEGSDYTTGSLFVNGLTFMNFTANRILPIKHIFFLGMDAASFPGRDNANSLDLCTSEPWPGDTPNAYKNRYAFLCQFMSTSDSIHLSYVDKNLQKDEDFYPSSVINDLIGFCGKQALQVTHVPLDETRNIKDLFTRRAFRNKHIYTSMLENSLHNGETVFETFTKPILSDLPERVTLSKLKNYLKDPFQFRVGELLQTDDEIDPEKIVFEPIDVETIKLLDKIKALAQVFIKKALQEINEADAQEREDQIINDFRKALRESGFRAAALYEELIVQKIVNGAENVADLMLTGNLSEADDDNDIDLTITQEVWEEENPVSTIRWQLQGQAEWHKWGPGTLDITSVTLGALDESFRYLTAFVHALALVLKKGRESECMDTEFNVTLHLCGTIAIQEYTRDFAITPEEAETLIERIYQFAYIERFAKAAPMKILEAFKTKKGELKTKIKSFNDLKDQLENEHGPWQYFPKGKIFDLNTDIGYSAYKPDEFKKEWNAVKAKQLGLIEKLKPLRLPEESQTQQ
ncbi:MAG: exodeoxyribonuclease V subunit gamma [Proteobacteria bacterium]|nr:exodeoxyribonuclease V subunit gamma [Pseudomonadota bacterium]